MRVALHIGRNGERAGFGRSIFFKKIVKKKERQRVTLQIIIKAGSNKILNPGPSTVLVELPFYRPYLLVLFILVLPGSTADVGVDRWFVLYPMCFIMPIGLPRLASETPVLFPLTV